MINTFDASQAVRVHATVLERGWAGFIRHHDAGKWEFHATLDTLGEPLKSVPLQVLLDADPSLWQLESLPPMSQAWRWEAGDEFQTSHLPIGATYFFQVEVTPTADNPDCDAIEGAVVTCWIRIHSEAAAEELLHREPEKSHWLIDSLAGPEVHTQDDYSEDATDVEYFDQAQTDGLVFVFHVYDEDE